MFFLLLLSLSVFSQYTPIQLIYNRPPEVFPDFWSSELLSLVPIPESDIFQFLKRLRPVKSIGADDILALIKRVFVITPQLLLNIFLKRELKLFPFS
jgi:hypothetical protein